MLWKTLSVARDFGRLHEIASVLIRFGFGDVVSRIGLGHALERAGRALKWKQMEELTRLSPAERARRALEELGPTFVKLGQVLSTRVDLFPPEWIEEFERLQDRMPPVAFEELRPQLEEDLGASPERVFAAFDAEPLAAASIAQVHRARLEDGTEIVVKVRRPGIRPVVEADLRLLTHMVEIAEQEIPELRDYRPREILRQFKMSLRREMDFASECRSAERIAKNFAGDETIVIPKVYWAWTGERVNVQDFVDGVRGGDIEAVEEAGLDRKLLARRGASAVLRMIVEHGFFHADPHPGNIFFLPGNRIAVIDFGMVGRLSELRRRQVVDLLGGVVDRDVTLVNQVLMDWAGDARVDADALSVEVDAFIDRYHGMILKEFDMGAMLSDLAGLLREHHLALPPDLALLLKALITLDGFGRQLDPEFDMVGTARPYLERAMAQRYGVEAVLGRGRRGLMRLADLAATLPRDLSQILRAARRGTITARMEVINLDRLGARLDRAASRIAMALVTAATVLGTFILIALGGGPTVAGVPIFTILGLIGSAFGGVWLLASVWRSGRH